MKQQYLGFRLGERDYVTSLDLILEVRAYDVRRRPARVFVNSLQEEVPIVNLRECLALGDFPRDTLPVVLVADLSGSLRGIVVDAVLDVMALEPGEIISAVGEVAEGLAVRGMVARHGRQLFVVDLARYEGGASRCAH